VTGAKVCSCLGELARPVQKPEQADWRKLQMSLEYWR
jgi:hypothetical protein